MRAETLSRANVRLVDAQSGNAPAQRWGGGEVASADGLRFVVPVRTINAGTNAKFFRAGGGLPSTIWCPISSLGSMGLSRRGRCATV